MHLTRLSILVRLELGVRDPLEAPKLIGRAIEEAMARLQDTKQIGGPVIIGLLGARRTRPRRAPSASRGAS